MSEPRWRGPVGGALRSGHMAPYDELRASAETTSPRHGERASVDLYWLPLGAGAGGQCVRVSGRLYEGLAAMRQH